MAASSPEHLEGGCTCGAVRYRLKSPPMFVNCCHCRDCQRQTGSAFVINGVIEADRIELTKGNPEAILMPTGSGRPHDIYRCPECRTALWSDYGRRPMRFVRMSTLDEAAAFRPDAHIGEEVFKQAPPLADCNPSVCVIPLVALVIWVENSLAHSSP